MKDENPTPSECDELIPCLARDLLRKLYAGKITRAYIENRYTNNKKKPESFRQRLKDELNRQRDTIRTGAAYV